MRSRSFRVLLSMEWRELLASRAYWLLLLMTGPLVGHGFITAKEGKRSFVKKGNENVHLDMNTWHALKVSIHGTNMQAALDDKPLLDYTLAEPVSGKIGLWSKTDSISYFDDFTVAPAQ